MCEIMAISSYAEVAFSSIVFFGVLKIVVMSKSISTVTSVSKFDSNAMLMLCFVVRLSAFMTVRCVDLALHFSVMASS